MYRAVVPCRGAAGVRPVPGARCPVPGCPVPGCRGARVPGEKNRRAPRGKIVKLDVIRSVPGARWSGEKIRRAPRGKVVKSDVRSDAKLM